MRYYIYWIQYQNTSFATIFVMFVLLWQCNWIPALCVCVFSIWNFVHIVLEMVFQPMELSNAKQIRTASTHCCCIGVLLSNIEHMKCMEIKIKYNGTNVYVAVIIFSHKNGTMLLSKKKLFFSLLYRLWAKNAMIDVSIVLVDSYSRPVWKDSAVRCSEHYEVATGRLSPKSKINSSWTFYQSN